MMAAPSAARLAWLGHESLRLTLSLNGRFAGEQVWQTQPEKFSGLGSGAAARGYQTRVQTDFGGVLAVLRKVQVSRYFADGSSLSYAESDGRNKPHFETFFDPASALITLRQHREEASLPLLTPHYDPVSLVMALRGPGAPTQLWRAALSGGAVHVQPLPGTEASGVAARAFYLRPGGAVVVSELGPPYRLLRLVQPTDFGPVEASLQFETPASEPRRKAAERPEKPDRPRRRRG